MQRQCNVRTRRMDKASGHPSLQHLEDMKPDFTETKRTKEFEGQRRGGRQHGMERGVCTLKAVFSHSECRCHQPLRGGWPLSKLSGEQLSAL